MANNLTKTRGMIHRIKKNACRSLKLIRLYTFLNRVITIIATTDTAVMVNNSNSKRQITKKKDNDKRSLVGYIPSIVFILNY